MVLDSGASKSFLPVKQYKGNVQERKGESVAQARDVKRTDKDSYVKVDSVLIGTQPIKNMEIKLQGEYRVIGQDFLRQYCVRVDYKQKKMWFGQSQPDKTRDRPSGSKK